MATPPLAPGPRGHFLSGNLPEYRRDALGFLNQLVRVYGNFVSFRFGWRRFILLNDPKASEDVLVTHQRNFVKNFVVRQSRSVLGNGLILSDGEHWLRQRRLAQPAFHKNRIAAYGDVMAGYAERLLASWRDGETRDIHPEMM